MKNERDVQFTPDATSSTQDATFVPDPNLADGGPVGGAGAFGSGTTGAYNAGTFRDTAQHAGSAAGDAADSVRHAAGDKAEDLRARAGEGLGQARQMAGEMQDRAVDQVRSRLDEQKHRAAGSLSSLAQTLRSPGESIQDQEGIGRYLARAADEVEHLANYLEQRDVGELMGQVEDFARRQPIAFLGGAFTLGLLGARFLKSSRGNLGYSGSHRGGGSSGFDNRALTSRVRDPEQDSVGRPQAPGYAAPTDRGVTGGMSGGMSGGYDAGSTRRDF